MDLNRIAVACLAVVLVACEAPLNLAGVDAESKLPIHRFDRFQAVAASDQALVVVGNYGAVVWSSDNGQRWHRHDLPGHPTLIDVVACNDGRFAALAFEHLLWQSDDHGETWTAQKIDTAEDVQTITCDPQGNIWIAGSFSTVLSSSDGGASWEEKSFDEDLIFTSIQFVDDDVAMLVGEFGTVVASENGGADWTYRTPIPGEFYPQAAFFADRDRGWTVGLNGTIFETEDGARSWTRRDVGNPVSLYGVTGNDKQVFASGDGGALYALDNGDWKALHTDEPVRSHLRGISLLSSGELLVAGGSGALVLLDVTGEAAQ